MRAVNKEILRLALPSILANLTVPLVGMVDIAVAGHLDSSAAALIGGISIGSLMFDVLYWNFGFLRAGTGGLTAQSFGRGDMPGCSAILARGVGTALAVSLALILLQWPFQKLFFAFVNCSDVVKDLALKYFFLRIWCAPATLALMAMRGWFIGMQDTFSSMLTDVVVNGINIAASIVLAMGLPGTRFGGMGFTGIALGTVAAQYAGLVFASVRIFMKYRNVAREILAPECLREAFRGEDMKRFFTVNKDLFVRSLCLIAVYLGYSAISARFGDVPLAMCAVMMKLLMIFSYFTDGFAYSGEALTGKNIGRKDASGVRETVKWTFVWSLGVGAFFVGIYAFGGLPMFRIMTSDAQVVDACRPFLPWLVLMPLAGCPAFTWDGIYIGATATRAMRNANIGCAVAFFAVWLIGSWLLSPQGDGLVHLLFAAYFVHLFYRSLYQTVRYRREILSQLS